MDMSPVNRHKGDTWGFVSIYVVEAIISMRSVQGSHSAGKTPLITDNGVTIHCVEIYCTPMRWSKGANTNHVVQLLCKICCQKTSNQCSKCNESIFPLFGRNIRSCFKGHYKDKDAKYRVT